MSIENYEAGLRRRAQAVGLRIARGQGPQHLDNYGLYQLVEVGTNVVLEGANFDLSLDRLEALLALVERWDGIGPHPLRPSIPCAALDARGAEMLNREGLRRAFGR